MTASPFEALGLALFGAIDPSLSPRDAHGLSARPIDAVDLAHRYGWVPSASLARALAALPGPDLMGLCGRMESLFSEANSTLKGHTSPLYRSFPNRDVLPFPDDLAKLLGMIFDLRAWGNLDPDLFGADPFNGQQNDDFGPDPLADAVFFQDFAGRGKGRLRVLHLADAAFWGKKARALLHSRVAPTPQEHAFLTQAAQRGYVDADVLQGLRFREKLPLLADAVAWDVYREAVESPTDVLRLAAHWSANDASLQSTVRFTASTSQAKRLMDALNLAVARDKDAAYEQVARHAETWKRLATQMRAHRWAKRFPLAAELLDDLRTSRMQTMHARVEHASFVDKVALLSTRPGMYVRSTLALLRAADGEGAGAHELVLEGLAKALPKVNALSALMLLVRLRADGGETPHFLPNGKVMWSQPKAVQGARAQAIVEGHLRARLQGTLPWSAGPFASDRLLPTAARSASESSERVARGDRIRINTRDQDTLRLFLHWKDAGDIDLSALFLDDHGKRVAACSYMNLNVGAYAVHSGDIRDGHKGAAEYIDIHVGKARKAGVRYVAMTGNVFHGTSFDTFPAHAGVMVRDGKTGAHFEIESVAHKMRVSCAAMWTTVAVFDLQEGTLIAMDMPSHAQQGHNIDDKTSNLVKDIDLVTKMGTYRPDMGLVLSLMGTPGAPALDGDALVQEMDAIVEKLSTL